jgi:hypothetical protein
MKGKKHKSYGKKPLLKQKKQKESKTIISLPFLEGLFNRSNFVTFISVICIILFIMLQIMEKRIANGPQIQNFINSSYEVRYFFIELHLKTNLQNVCKKCHFTTVINRA